MNKLEDSTKNSQIHLIIERFLLNLEMHTEFEENSKIRLRALVESGQLKNSDSLEEAIMIKEGERNEDK